MKALKVVAALLLAYSAGATETVVRGWLSDEECARGRASSGVYTQTNPDCARECVRSGKKIVLIDPDGHRLLMIQNQQEAMSNVGNYVAVTGQVNNEKQTVYVTSVKLLEVGRASCERPKKTNK